MLASAGEVIGIVVVAVVAGVGIGAAFFMSRCVKIVQQGSVGVVKRFGEFQIGRPARACASSRPFVDKMEKVDMREFPMTGDQQAVITKDNVLAAGERHHLLPGHRREVGPLRDQRLPAGRRPALAHRAAGRLRRALAGPGALRARDDQQPHAGPHGRRHG